MKKPLQLKDLTELTQEWVLHDEGHKKFTLVINFVHGVPHIKYGVYRGTLCVALSKDIEKMFDKYVALEEYKEENTLTESNEVMEGTVEVTDSQLVETES